MANKIKESFSAQFEQAVSDGRITLPRGGASLTTPPFTIDGSASFTFEEEEEEFTVDFVDIYGFGDKAFEFNTLYKGLWFGSINSTEGDFESISVGISPITAEYDGSLGGIGYLGISKGGGDIYTDIVSQKSDQDGSLSISIQGRNEYDDGGIGSAETNINISSYSLANSAGINIETETEGTNASANTFIATRAIDGSADLFFSSYCDGTGTATVDLKAFNSAFDQASINLSSSSSGLISFTAAQFNTGTSIPEYVDHPTAAGDGQLLSGSLYTVAGSTAVHKKP